MLLNIQKKDVRSPINTFRFTSLSSTTSNLASGAINGSLWEMFIEQGFDDYLSKPIIAARLEEMIQKYLPEEIVIKNDLYGIYSAA